MNEDGYFIDIHVLLTAVQQALKHRWLSGENASDHNLLPEIKAYMAKARLRRGIELVKLTNRIEALKIQEDDPENPDFPENAKAAAEEAQEAHVPESETSSGGPGRLSRAVKGAIFREIVLAKVREMKEQEETLKIKQEVEKEAQRKGSSS